MVLTNKDIEIAFENKNEISEKRMFEILEKNNFEHDFRIMILTYGTNPIVENGIYLIENIHNVYISYGNYENKNKMNDFIKQIHELEIEMLPIKDYSKNENVCYVICNKKCIFDFGKSKNCINCNYYNDCITEHEIDDFERQKDLELKNFYDMLENDFYR